MRSADARSPRYGKDSGPGVSCSKPAPERAFARRSHLPRTISSPSKVLWGAGIAVAVLPELIAENGAQRVVRIPLKEETSTERTVGIAYLTSQRRHYALGRFLAAGDRYVKRNEL